MKKALFFFAVLLHLGNISKAQPISTFAGVGSAGYSGDGGPATSAQLNGLHGIVSDAIGNIYIADKFNNVIRKVNTAGIISTFAGTGAMGHSGDGGPATAAELNNPFQLAIDATGNLYFCEESNYIRMINSAGIISTIAGNGLAGAGGDGGPATAASFNRPEGIAIDASGNIYISDFYNSKVRKINTSGIISTFAGNGVYSYSGDGGPASAAGISYPNFLCLDHSGNLLISDNDNHVIRKVNAGGIITTFAGNGSASYSGDGGPATAATLYFPCGIFEDASYNIFIADQINNRIRKVDLGGTISTVAGTGSGGYSGDGGAALAAELNQPVFVYMDNWGNLFISDFGNSVLRKIQYTPTFVSDSFNIFVNQSCSGPQIIDVPNHYFPGMFVKTLFGDGSIDSSTVAGTTGSSVTSHTYYSSGTFTIKQILCLGGAALDSFSFSYNHTLCNSFAVNLYIDNNGNCTQDTSENLLSQSVAIEVDSNSVAIDTLSATSGFSYNAYGITGDIYGFRAISMPAGFHVSCPSTGIIYDTLGGSNLTKTVGVECNTSSSFDLGIYSVVPITGTFDQQGDIYVQNAYCTPTNATITLHHSSKYPGTPAYVSPPPTSITTNAITWNISSLSSTDDAPAHMHYVIYIAGTYLIPGDTVHSFFTIDPTTGDLDTTDNSDVRVDTVRAGCDPNELWVSPSGCIASGVSPTQLKYTINFENTGNDTAHNIYVMDTLSDNVDASSMRIIMSSHQMFVSKLRDAANHNVLKFDFPKINLLDSSHHGKCDGAVIFTINTKSGLANGADIINRAGIYFDVNAVVMTNEVDNIIGCGTTAVNNAPKTDAVDIFPNPASDVLNIKMTDSRFQSFVIVNTVGAVLVTGNLTNTTNKVNIQALPSGVYFIALKGVKGGETRKFVKW